MKSNLICLILVMITMFTVSYGCMSGDNCECCAKNSTYPRKGKIVALTYSLTVGFFGGDWFYLSCGNGAYILAGLLKCVLGVIFVSILTMHIVNVFAKQYREDNEKICVLNDDWYNYMWMYMVVAVISLAWYGVDLFRLLYDKFRDGNCMELGP